MLCSNCSFENSENAKFCMECGAPIEFHCPDCGEETSVAGKFCMACGFKLKSSDKSSARDLTFGEKLDKIQRYLPKGITEKILSQRGKIEGERKQVTVMFCDLEGFTPLSEQLGPENAYNLMDEVYEILIHKVHDYEGTVNEMTGDGIMALFGAPIALEDAAQRAVRSSLSIHREIAKYSNRKNKEQVNINSLKMRIGIHTGTVIVGTLGNSLHVEFKAVGDTVNTASRIEGLAEPGSTYISNDTYKIIEGLFRVESLGLRQIKGKQEPVQIYRVLAPNTRRTRFDVSAESGLTTFVGRERECELLLDGYERAKAGKGQAFSIVAEAGVGKSRLLYEFRKAIANEDVTLLEGKCLSYSRNVAYHLHIDILKANFDIRENDSAYDIKDKIIKGLEKLGINEHLTLPLMMELIGVNVDGIGKCQLSPEMKKDHVREILKKVILKGAEIRPLILIFEDLHWIDKSSEEILNYLLDSIPGAQILIIFTYRPEYGYGWGAKSYHNQLNLNQLSSRETLLLASYLLGSEFLEKKLEELILGKTEGIPFFIEEFVKSLINLKIIRTEDNRACLIKDYHSATIPITIQDMIMARVDALSVPAKELLQFASVIEREFSYKLIQQVTEFQERELLFNLSVLKDAELIYERGIYPESIFIFKHALTREILLGSLLIKKRNEIHEKIGCKIEEVFKENLNEYFEALSRHFIGSENFKKGAKYSNLAANKAFETGSYNEAIAYAKIGLESLEKLKQTEKVKREIVQARTTLGFYFLEIEFFHEIRNAVVPALVLATELDMKENVALLNAFMGIYYSQSEENLSKAIISLEEAIKVSEEVEDKLSCFIARYWLGVNLGFNCEFEKASREFKKALNIGLEINNITWIGISNFGLSFFVYFFQGRINQGYETSYKAIEISAKSDRKLDLAYANSAHGICCYGKGFLEEAEKYLLRALEVHQRHNDLIWSCVNCLFLGDILVEKGDYQNSISYYNNAVQFVEQSKTKHAFLIYTNISLVKAKIMNGELHENIESLYIDANKNPFPCWDGRLQREIGYILLNKKNQYQQQKAENWIKKSIKTDKKNNQLFSLAQDYLLYSTYYEQSGTLTKAKEYARKAVETFKECGADRWAEKYGRSITGS